jgi:hypothetical protein
METKPYRIQSPEDIAKDYGGNKQKIAQAMQMGVVDPTAGVLAGMFIDRMRSAQTQEQAPQLSVAQQVMGGAPPAPPQAGGLGATPPAAAPMAPPGGMGMAPPPAMPQPPMGMAEGGLYEAPYMKDGGLSELPIPDGMFDENRDGAYANGGIVAFADGGDISLDAFRRAIIAQESGGRFGIPNAQGSGAMGLGQIMPDTARALAKRLGLPYRPDLLAGKDKAAQEYQIALTNEATREAFEYGKGDLGKASAYYFAGPDKSQWGPKTKRYQSDIARRLGTSSGEANAVGAANSVATPALGGDLAFSFPGAYEEGARFFEKNMPAPKREARDAILAQIKGDLDPEKLKKQSKQDRWATLAEIGFNMAASNSPYFLQAVGAAASAALPGAKADKKEREAKKREALRTYAEIEGLDNQEAREKVNFGLNFANTKLGLKDKDLSRALSIWQTTTQETGATSRSNAQIQGQKDVATINKEAQLGYFEKQDALLRKQVGAAAEAQLPQLVKDPTTPVGKAYTAYQMAIKKFGANSDSTARAAAALETAKINHVNAAINRVSGAFMGGSGYGEPPAGAVVPVGK